MKSLGISFNVSEVIGKMIFPQLIFTPAVVTSYHLQLHIKMAATISQVHVSTLDANILRI